MDILTLHAVLSAWWIDDYPLRLIKIRAYWHVLPVNSEADQWLKANRLDNASFRTRRDALQATRLALQMPEAISPSKKPHYRPTNDGYYQLAGEMTAQRSRSNHRWVVHSAAGRALGYAPSLWRAAWIAQQRLDDLLGSQQTS